jgi:hypothetical protein
MLAEMENKYLNFFYLKNVKKNLVVCTGAKSRVLPWYQNQKERPHFYSYNRLHFYPPKSNTLIYVGTAFFFFF